MKLSLKPLIAFQIPHHMNKQLVADLQQLFREKFSADPVVYFSPGRINLIGEHIDYNDGYVLPAAINKGVYYAIAPNNSDTCNFYSADFNEGFSVDARHIEKAEGWKNYVLSVLNEFLLLGIKTGGFDCVISGDIPRGSGMSSSAAVEGGLAFALNELFDGQLDKTALALLCQRAEHNFPAVKCGIMDQFANMLGKKDHVILLDCKNITYRYFPLRLDEYEIVLVNSKVHHSLAGSAYNERRRQCEEGLKILEAASFRDVTTNDVLRSKDKMSEAIFNRCVFVTEEIRRTLEASALLEQNKLAAFGELMYQTHDGLSKLYEVSCAELDFLVDAAKKQDAVIGSRLMGGGFGGCTINLVQKKSVENFREAIVHSYQVAFNTEPEIYVVQTSDGTQRIS